MYLYNIFLQIFSQIYNTAKYNFSKISLNDGRLPYYAALSEIKTDSSFSSLETLYLISHLSWCHTLYFSCFLYFSLSFFLIILTLQSFCEIPCVQKSQKLPADVWEWGCVTGQAHPSPFTWHTFLIRWAVTRSKRRWLSFILFYLKAVLPVLEHS